MFAVKSFIKSIKFSSLYFVTICVGLASCGMSETEVKIEGEQAPEASQTIQPSVSPTSHAEDHEQLAESYNHEQTRSAESHIHGGAMLSVVLENKTVTVELESPLFNLVGFEYQPHTETEKQEVIRAEGILSKPQDLVIFNKAAKCTYEPSNLNLELFDHHTEEHEDRHEEDGHHEKTDKEATHADDSSHNEIVLTYTAMCGAPEKLKTVTADFFMYFPNLSDLDFVYLGPSVQRSYELSNSKTSVDISR